MKLKSLGIAVITAIALMAFASTASATTLAITGVPQNNAVTMKGSLEAGSSTLLATTGGGFVNTCTTSTVEGTTTSPFSGVTGSGTINSLEWSGCTEGNPTVDSAGSLSVERIGTTSNGTVRSNGAKITLPSFFGSLTCTTNNTDIGQITGTTEGSPTMHINAVINCGIIPSAKWTGTYRVTEPHALTLVE